MVSPVQEKRAFQSELRARQVSKFERKSGQNPVCGCKQELNSFSMVRKQNSSRLSTIYSFVLRLRSTTERLQAPGQGRPLCRQCVRSPRQSEPGSPGSPNARESLETDSGARRFA